MQRLLTQAQEQLLHRERAWLDELRVHLARLDATEEDLTLLKQSRQQMEELFLLVVVGEFNAGKTAFLNALLGSKLLTEGVTPTTSHIHILRYGETLHQQMTEQEVLIIQAPVEWLREVNLVDTPGTNAVVLRHQQITEHFVPRSDLVLFVTSIDRPFSESERRFLEQIRQWDKKVIVIINKIDLVPDPADRAQILDFVRENGQSLLGRDPQIFSVSARQAMQAKDTARQNGNRQPQGELWESSQFGALEKFLLQHLNDSERLRLKLSNPLGIGGRLLDQYQQVINERQEILKEDFQTIDTIEEQLTAYETDMRRDFQFQSSRIDNVLYAMAERGDLFFEDTLRITRIAELINGEKLRADFERQVVADTSRQVERHVNELIDWVVDKDYRQWQAVMEYLKRRAAHHEERMVGQVNSTFEFNRQNLLASVGREAQRVVDSYDREAESLQLAQAVQSAIFQTAAVEVGALGLGALLVALLHTTLLDITGVLGASVVAALGLYVLPYRRARLKADLRERINQLRDQLKTAVTQQFEQELQDSIQRMREAIAPYTRFVRVEREKLEKISADLQVARTQLTSLRNEIQKL